MTSADKTAKIERLLSREATGRLPNGSLSFLPEREGIFNKTAGGGIFGRMQSALKKRGKLYKTIRTIIKPVLASPAYRRRCRDVLGEFSAEDTVVHLGSGPTYFEGREDLVNVDIFDFAEVDIVADAHALPFKDESVDLLISLSVLEHVRDPAKVVSEIHRVLKPGGAAVCAAPFMAPFHAAPADFTRWTCEGLRALFGRMKDVEVLVAGGPTSALLWVFQEWFAVTFSFGSRFLRDLLFAGALCLTFPFKLLDFLLLKNRLSVNVAVGFCAVVRK